MRLPRGAASGRSPPHARHLVGFQKAGAPGPFALEKVGEFLLRQRVGKVRRKFNQEFHGSCSFVSLRSPFDVWDSVFRETSRPAL